MSLMCGGGGGDGGEPVDPEQEKKNKAIAAKTKKDEDDDGKVVKMLLLGAGESGKSTIFKQMKVINKDGYTEEERRSFQSIVWSNTIVSMKALLGAYEKLDTEMPGDVKKMGDDFETQSENEKLYPELGALIKSLWTNESVQGIFAKRNEFQLNDSAEYYFNEIERISESTYLPTVADVLRSRVRTTGIVQSDFKIKATNFSMFDVGGQRNERRKWIHCFDHVNAVVFVAALSEFDQVLYEDETQNRLDEALDLFKQIANSKWFKDTSLILFLNKKDLFENKLQKKKFSDYRKEYDGENTLEACGEYCKKAFIALLADKAKPIYPHITTATDTGNVKFVFNAVVAILLDANLKSSGLV